MYFNKSRFLSSTASSSVASETETKIASKVNINDSFCVIENPNKNRRITIVRPTEVKTVTQEELAKELEEHKEEQPKQSCMGACCDSIADSCMMM
jgi:hypothetical protein